MEKIKILSVFLLFSVVSSVASAGGATTCTVTSDWLGPIKPTQVVLENSPGKAPSMIIDGEQHPVIQVVEAKVKDPEALFRCDGRSSDFNKCLDDYWRILYGSSKDIRMTSSTLVMMWESSHPAAAVKSKKKLLEYSFDLKKVGYIRFYLTHISVASEIGNMGFVSFFDNSKRLLGHAVQSFDVIECK